MIAGRLELLLLLIIVVHGKVLTHRVGWPQTVHDLSMQWLAVPWAQLVLLYPTIYERSIVRKKFVSVVQGHRYNFRVH